jgi:ABC-type lipoprotein release transport system permease subunit
MAGARAFLSWLGQQKTHFEAMVKSEGWPILEEPKLYGWAVVFALGLGLVASLLPSLRAARVEPVDVLRGQIG